MAKKLNRSAGILLYRFIKSKLEVMLVHPGGPFWKNKDLGTWSIPKGEITESESAKEAAMREFAEETGFTLENLSFLELTPVKLKSGKMVYAWAAEGDIDVTRILSNEFQLEWPPRSGKFKSFPEVDKGAWFSAEEAIEKINTAQVALITQLVDILSRRS